MTAPTLPRSLFLLAIAVAGCGTVQPSEAPSVAPVSPSAVGSLELVCPGLMMSGVIDYARDAPGVADIVAGTRALHGIQSSDLVLSDGDATTVVRQGRPIWTGQWLKGNRGYLLTYVTACTGVGIGDF